MQLLGKLEIAGHDSILHIIVNELNFIAEEFCYLVKKVINIQSENITIYLYNMSIY